MSTSLKQILTSAFVALVVALGVAWVMHGSTPAPKAGTTTVSNLNTNAPDGQYTGTQGGLEADLGFFDAAGAVSNILAVFGFGTTVATQYNFEGSSGSCATKATSTIFAVANPFAATSTATVIVTYTTASSTLLEVGTSTRSTGITTTAISPTLVNSTIASSTNSAVYSGVTVGGLGYTSAGSATFQRIGVGPNDFVVGFATDTLPGFTVGLSSCTYKILWNN